MQRAQPFAVDFYVSTALPRSTYGLIRCRYYINDSSSTSKVCLSAKLIRIKLIGKGSKGSLPECQGGVHIMLYTSH